MANLCKNCSEKTPVTPMRGQCQAKRSSKCTGWTNSFSFTLCDPCSEETGRCAWCWGPLNGRYPVIVVPTDKRFCRVFEGQSGKHVKKMYIGEQILVQLTVAGYGTSFRLRRLAGGVSFYDARSVPDPNNPSQGWVELYFDLNEATTKAEIEIDILNYGSPPRRFTCTAEVRH